VIPDLRGYGRSDKPPGDPEHNTYSKATLAKDQVATMQSLGFSQFSVAGHDRGGRVAYRLALDFPKVVTRIAVLDIVPTSDAFALMNAASAMKMWHWLFQVHENGLPERMIAAVSDEYVSTFLSGPAAPGFQFNPMSLHDYLACFRSPEAIHAACEDYRAAWHVDRRLDEEQVGKIKLSMPLLILWADEGGIAHAKPLEIWRRWADDVQGHGVPGGHFLPEESPKIVTEALVKFFDG
jgi:haloacetate dehalogenase